MYIIYKPGSHIVAVTKSAKKVYTYFESLKDRKEEFRLRYRDTKFPFNIWETRSSRNGLRFWFEENRPWCICHHFTKEFFSTSYKSYDRGSPMKTKPSDDVMGCLSHTHWEELPRVERKKKFDKVSNSLSF